MMESPARHEWQPVETGSQYQQRNASAAANRGDSNQRRNVRISDKSSTPSTSVDWLVDERGVSVGYPGFKVTLKTFRPVRTVLNGFHPLDYKEDGVNISGDYMFREPMGGYQGRLVALSNSSVSFGGDPSSNIGTPRTDSAAAGRGARAACGAPRIDAGGYYG